MVWPLRMLRTRSACPWKVLDILLLSGSVIDVFHTLNFAHLMCMIVVEVRVESPSLA